jgi:hypothetical protein
MLSEEAIEKLVQPIIARQERINEYVIKVICERIKEIGTLTPSDIYSLTRLLKSGSDVRKINKEIARQTGLQVQDIKRIIREVALDNYKDARPFYDYRMLPFIPITQNKPLMNIVKAIANQTAGTYVNMAKSQAFMIRDFRNPQILRPTSISQTYYSVIDEAVQAAQSGVIDYNTAVRRTVKQLGESGLKYAVYNTETGRTYCQRMDTAVRRNILDGIRAINQAVQDETGRQYGADGKEITVHEYPALDHAPVQGHQFTNEEYAKLQGDANVSFKDVDGEVFSHFDRHIGTLNCRHFTYSIIVGFANPNYSKKELQEILDRNEEGYTLPNGKHLTMYDCTQKQRQYETAIRKAKDGQVAAVASGDEELAKEYQARVDKFTKQYKQFSDECGLKIQTPRIQVSGYRQIKL